MVESRRAVVRPVKSIGIVAVVVCALIFNPITIRAATSAGVRNFKVDGSSMQPTLQNGEFFVINRFDTSPSRGTIVVVQDPRKPDTDLMKRVIGLPGETLEIRGGKVYINGSLLDEPYIKSPWHDNRPVVSIPSGRYYVMGDNRDNSLDSRSSSVGLIPSDLILGSRMFGYWPAELHPWGLAIVLSIAGALLVIGIAMDIVGFLIARNRGRSGWWVVLPFVFAGFGLAFVYFFVRRRKATVAV